MLSSKLEIHRVDVNVKSTMYSIIQVKSHMN